MSQLIRASWYTPRLAFEAKKQLVVSKKDYVKEGYKPTAENANGILMEIEDLPLAYWDIPTLNQMVFRKPLWERLLKDPDLQFRMTQCRNFWGEADHSDRTEIHLPDVSHKVTNFYCGDQNFVRGSVAILDTPNGNILYTLMKDGDVGWSSRGWGDLVPSSEDPKIQNVLDEAYMHICWDAVAQPAVPECLSRIVQSLKEGNVTDQVLSYLRKFPSPVYSSIAEKIEEDSKKSFQVPDRKGADTRPFKKAGEEDADKPVESANSQSDKEGVSTAINSEDALGTPPAAPEAEVAAESQVEGEETDVAESDKDIRKEFSETVLSELGVADSRFKIEDERFAVDGRDFLLEEGYLIQLNVAAGDSILKDGALSVDLYAETAGAVADGVSYIINLIDAPDGGMPEEDIQIEE